MASRWQLSILDLYQQIYYIDYVSLLPGIVLENPLIYEMSH